MTLTPFFSNSVKGAAIIAYSLIKVLYHPIIPKNPCTSLTFLGIGHSMISLTLAGSTGMPSSKTINPKYSICGEKNLHLLFLA